MEYIYRGRRSDREVSAVSLWTILVIILVVLLILVLIGRV
jgi:hypothetical protein